MKLKDLVNVLKKSAYVNYSFPGLLSSHRWNCQDAARNTGQAGWNSRVGQEGSRQGGRRQKTEAQQFFSTKEDLGDNWSVETVETWPWSEKEETRASL